MSAKITLVEYHYGRVMCVDMMAWMYSIAFFIASDTMDNSKLATENCPLQFRFFE